MSEKDNARRLLKEFLQNPSKKTLRDFHTCHSHGICLVESISKEWRERMPSDCRWCALSMDGSPLRVSLCGSACSMESGYIEHDFKRNPAAVIASFTLFDSLLDLLESGELNKDDRRNRPKNQRTRVKRKISS